MYTAWVFKQGRGLRGKSDSDLFQMFDNFGVFDDYQHPGKNIYILVTFVGIRMTDR